MDSIFKGYASKIARAKKVTKIEEEVKQDDLKDKVVKADIRHLLLKEAGIVREDDKVVATPEKQEPEQKIETQTRPIQTSTQAKSILDLLKKQEIKQVEKLKTPTGVEYEEYDPKNVRFMRQFDRYELKHKDHSGLIVAKDCFRKYFYKEVICLVPKEDNSIFYPWGSAYHIFRQKLTEYYGYGENEPKIYDPTKARESFKKAAREGTEYWMKNGEDQKPDTKYDWYTTERLYKSFVTAFESWVDERKKGLVKIVAVEQYFVVQLPDRRFVQGRVDETLEVQKEEKELWGRDFKTTSKPEDWFARALAPNNQVRTYTYGNSKLAGRKAKGLIIQALYNGKTTKQGDKGPSVYEKLIEVTDYELKQWELEQTVWNEFLEVCRERDVWPQSETGCPWCDYQRVCVKGSEASMMYVLETKYERKLRNPAHIDSFE